MNDKANINPILHGSIIPTFFYYVVPSIIGLVAITTANLVDGAFVGNFVGSDALASITLLIPYFTLLFGIALMFAIGGSVRAGTYIGEDNVDAASSIFSKSLISIFLFSSTAALLGFIFDDFLYRALGAPEHLYPLMAEYFQIITFVLIIQLVTMVLYYFVRTDGHPLIATFALLVGAVLNMLLDAAFIGYLDMGLKGAAYATAIGQIVQLLILMRYFASPNKTLTFSIKQSQWLEMARASFNGLSEFVNEISGGIIILLLNWLLISRLGVDGIAAFTVVNFMIFLSLMLSYGVADALHLLVSQNFGARNSLRIQQFFLTAIASVSVIGLVLISLLLFWQDAIILLFLDEESADVASISSDLISTIWPLFLVNGINILLSCYLTAMHQPLPSTAVALSRSLFLPAGLLAVFYLLLPEQPFLIALPIAEWLTFFLASVLCIYHSPAKLVRQASKTH
jgi:putative MATE family efflux protein